MTNVLSEACKRCNERQEMIKAKINELMDLLGTETMFATRQYDGRDLVLMCGGSVCTDEFELPCIGCESFEG